MRISTDIGSEELKDIPSLSRYVTSWGRKISCVFSIFFFLSHVFNSTSRDHVRTMASSVARPLGPKRRGAQPGRPPRRCWPMTAKAPGMAANDSRGP